MSSFLVSSYVLSITGGKSALIADQCEGRYMGCCDGFKYDTTVNRCIECKAGYYQENCSFRCRYNTYGRNCEQICLCSKSECHFEYGCKNEKQECEVGYYEENCSSRCPNGTYGKDCQEICSCSEDECHFERGCKNEKQETHREDKEGKSKVTTYSILRKSMPGLVFLLIFVMIAYMFLFVFQKLKVRRVKPSFDVENKENGSRGKVDDELE